MTTFSNVILAVAAFINIAEGLNDPSLWRLLIGFGVSMVLWRENSLLEEGSENDDGESSEERTDGGIRGPSEDSDGASERPDESS